MQRSAIISTCGHYRYELRRVWQPAEGLVVFVGLNPSTADANIEDPTLRRCIDFAIDFAMRWGYGGLVMLNLFAYRSTSPRELPKVADAIGPENDATIQRVKEEAKIIIVAWGKQPWQRVGERARAVSMLLHPAPLHAIATTEDGHPRHPLYLKAELRPALWDAIPS